MSDSTPQRNVIALLPEACTSCMVCVRECPSWCIFVESHVEEVSEEGARRPRIVNSPSTTACVCIAVSASKRARSTRLPGGIRSITPLATGRDYNRTRSTFLAGGLPVVDELNGEVKIGTFDQSDDVLQGVTTLVRNAQLVPLYLSFYSLGSIVSN